MLGFAEACQVGINRGDDRTFVAEVDLDLTEVLPLLQQMGRVRVAQRMDVRRLGDAAGLEGEAEGALQGGVGHGLGGGGSAQPVMTFGGKEQGRVAERFPLLAQAQQRALGQRDIAILISLAGPDVQEHALGIDVGDLQPKPFAQTQATRVNGEQADALIQGENGGQDAAHLGGGEDDGQFELRIGAHQLQFVRPNAFKGFFPEELEGADGLGAGLAGDSLVRLEVNAILANLLGGDQFGRFAIELAELADTGVIGFFGA
jgi:hypothetical protein